MLEMLLAAAAATTQGFGSPADIWASIVKDFSNITEPAAFAAFLQVLMIDLVLAGDNAIVVGALAAGLPPEQRKKVIFIGVLAALVLRILFALVVTQLVMLARRHRARREAIELGHRRELLGERGHAEVDVEAEIARDHRLAHSGTFGARAEESARPLASFRGRALPADDGDHSASSPTARCAGGGGRGVSISISPSCDATSMS